MRSRARARRVSLRRLASGAGPVFLFGLLAAAWGAAACGGSSQSFMVVTVQSADTTPITQVASLQVTVTNGASSQTLTYPAPDQVPFTITGTLDPATGKIGTTFSVSFSTAHVNDLVVQVSALNALGTAVGTGQADAAITPGGIASVTIALEHLYPGCDPAALTCGAAMTCAVNCAVQSGSCVAAGTGAAGSLCSQNVDCAPGTQCFSYGGGATTPGCQLGACLKFCKSDADCGSGSLCQGKVPCTVGTTTSLTAYHTCTFACDPRGAATTGCPAGLHCFLVDTMDQVDCACTQAGQTKVEGQDCTSGTECAPGLVCTSQCHKACLLAANNTDCGAGQTCAALTNDQIYGVCLP